MGKRKLIGLITAFPEYVNAQRVLEGVFSQCESYGYNVAVFAPMVQVCSYFKDYLRGELNIFEAINFDMLDGVIVDTIPLTEDRETEVVQYIERTLKSDCKAPVVSVGMPLGDYPTVTVDDYSVFREITSHVLDVHNCRTVYCLTGMQGDTVAENRLSGFVDEMNARGATVPQDHIFYGDFWYTSGAQLADRIADGELKRPDAVICTGDYAALGLVHRLKERGLRVPQDIIVTGFDVTHEGVMSDTSITSFFPDTPIAAAKAVQMIHSAIEPSEAEIEPAIRRESHLHAGMSCGCSNDLRKFKQIFKRNMYIVNRDWGEKGSADFGDIGMLLESYMYERISAANTVQGCLDGIHAMTYLIKPYKDFYLCLNQNWLDIEQDIPHGYSDTMKTVVHAQQGDGTGFANDNAECFDQTLMLPQMFEESEAPSVYYFSSVHTSEIPLGYAVLRQPFDGRKIDLVYRSWLRNVNSALDMTRKQNRLLNMSIQDIMTGQLNRRGMELGFARLMSSAERGSSVAVFVIDLDGLKAINDLHGHNEGDFAITSVARLLNSFVQGNEFCVRAGGDEFYVIGRGEYSEETSKQRMEQLARAVDDVSARSQKPYPIAASIGFACLPYKEGLALDDIIALADKQMYRNKLIRKQRQSERGSTDA